MGTIPFDSNFVADLREIAAIGNCCQLSGIKPTGMTIGAAVEIACLQEAFPSPLYSIVSDWVSRSSVLKKAVEVFKLGHLPSGKDMWKTRELEFFPIRGSDWAKPAFYHPFESRFKKAAKDAGFGLKATALSGALFEMADNIAQHGGIAATSPAPGLIGYHVSPGNVSFAVADTGRGVLCSLKDNPVWTELNNSKTALMAILEKHASRRIHGGDGEGFKQVFKSLIDLNGIVEMHSGDGRVRLTCAPDGTRTVHPQFTTSFSGLQIMISCSLQPPAKEVVFPFDNLT